MTEATIRLSQQQRQWLMVLSRMAAPLCHPGPEIASYKALANRNLATKEHWPNEPTSGWVITQAGRDYLKLLRGKP